ncbi:MAG: gamma-glutamylcyclotransferase [Comamonas sp.]
MFEAPTLLPAAPGRDPHTFLEQTLQQWGGEQDLWVFGYGSLIWRPEFDFAERRDAKVHGWHRALKMWSRINRGTPQQPGLVFAMLPGGSCQGAAFRIPAALGHDTLHALWQREMPLATYDPRWLQCSTPEGPVRALAFTLSRRSPSYCGTLAPEQYQRIFAESTGIYGSTRDYALATYDGLQAMGIRDRALEQVLHWGKAWEDRHPPAPPQTHTAATTRGR